MNKNLSLFLLFICDILVITFSIFMAVCLKNMLYGDEIFQNIFRYINFIPLYAIMILLFFHYGIYTRRYDFWHESHMVIKSSFLGFLLTLSFLALEKANYSYSRTVFVFSFIFMMIFLPSTKFILKRWLFKVGIWRKRARIIGESREFELELFTNHYLGYVRAKGKEYESIFIGGSRLSSDNLNELIEQNIKENKEILFSPILQSYDFSKAYIYNIFNSRTNVFAIQNSLKSKFNMASKRALDIFLILLSMPLLVPIFVIIMLAVKISEPKGSIFFSQPRLGLNGKIFSCYKFRSMCADQSFMNEWLEQNPDETEYYKIFKRYKNDPRITKIGKFLRKTSLDELPQLINVLKGDMSIVGPRPYLPAESVDFEDKIDLVLAVRPGITGIWQVSGRSDVDFATRAQMDTWYMKNWSVWNDIVIIIKTFKVVLVREGAS
ncbi:MAG: exopolysaccharide biosynthesis polyprenyl glycosylphosphotransferase [Campylobacteraceae bacterium]|nr:exopolysaccharide biosynthesis polyprenyl glycosylphosphotransferase [Campylobacteraceae bacterium]